MPKKLSSCKHYITLVSFIVRHFPVNNRKIKVTYGLIKVVIGDWLGNLANYKEDYNVSVCFMFCAWSQLGFLNCSRCDASLVYWPFPLLLLKAFCYLCTVNVIFQLGTGEQKHITKQVIKFPNQSTLLI